MNIESVAMRYAQQSCGFIFSLHQVPTSPLLLRRPPKMGSSEIKIIVLRESNESGESGLERFADHIGTNMLHQPYAHCINVQVPRDVERSPPWFLVYSALLQIEAGILQVHSQGSSPFDTHPTIIWIYVIAVFTHYVVALYYGKCFLTGSRCPKTCDLVGNISGSLASAAFLAILVPPFLVPLVFVIWVLHLPIYIDVARNWILKVTKMLYGHLSNGSVYVQGIWNSIIGSNNEGAINQPN